MMLRLTCHISPFIQLADRSLGRRVGGRGWWSVTLGGVLREREFGACCCVARSLDGVSLFSPFFNWSITPSDYRNFLFLYYDAIVVHVWQLCYEDDNKINFTCAKLSTPKTNMDDIGFRWEHSKNRGKNCLSRTLLWRYDWWCQWCYLVQNAVYRPTLTWNRRSLIVLCSYHGFIRRMTWQWKKNEKANILYGIAAMQLQRLFS